MWKMKFWQVLPLVLILASVAIAVVTGNPGDATNGASGGGIFYPMECHR